MRRFAVVCAVAGSALLIPGAALAAPPLNAAQRLCEAQGATSRKVPLPSVLFTPAIC